MDTTLARLDLKMLAGFVHEARSYLPEIHVGIQAFHADPTQRRGLSEALRYVHTIRGAAAMVGLTGCNSLTSYIAETLTAITAEYRPLDTPHVTRLHQSVDQLGHYLDSLLAGAGHEQTIAAEIERSFRQPPGLPSRAETGAEVLDAPAQRTQQTGATGETPARALEVSEDLLEDFLSEAEEYLTTIRRVLPELARQPGSRGLLQTVRRSMHTFKGIASIVGLRAVAHLVHRMEDLLAALYDSRLSVTTSVHELLCATCNVLDDFVRDHRAQGELPPAAAVLYHSYTQLLSDTTGAPVRPERLLEPWSGAVPVENQAAFEAVPEMAAMADLDSALARQGHQRSDRQDRPMQLRLVPLATLATRLHQIVRVTAQQQGKKAALWLEGEDVAFDTTVLAAMAEPLLHLLRNAVAHGIEPPALRQALGKPACGRIHLRAFTAGSQVVMQVRDDGTGLEPQVLRAAAVRGGLATAAEAAQFTEEQLFACVFIPGFSTAQAANEVCGRGLGMDIVQTTVRRLKGHIALSSTPGQGFTCTIRLPLTPATP